MLPRVPSSFYTAFTKCCFEDQLFDNFNCNETVTHMKKGKIIHLQPQTVSNTFILTSPLCLLC